MKNVIVSGGFDDLRSPQIRFLQEASRLGRVTVLLWPDELLTRRTGKPPKFPASERQYFLEAIRFVDRVILVPGIKPDELPDGPDFPSRAENESVASANPGDCRSRREEAPMTQMGGIRSTHPLAGKVGRDTPVRAVVHTPDAPPAGRGLPAPPASQTSFALATASHHGRTQPDVWAVLETDDTAGKRAYCASRKIEYRLITPNDLQGFPAVPVANLPNPGRKKVMVTGCYDWFHSGHVRFFEEVSQLGDLYVVVGHDANVRELKGAGHPLFPQEERRYVAQSIRFVRQCLISTGAGWLDAEPEIKNVKPDIYVVNEDGDRTVKREYCERNGIEYRVLKRLPKAGLPRRQSTDLRGF